jgi:DNA-binding transcriptional ArsR family regulator
VTDEVGPTFAALSDPTRLQVVSLLAGRDSVTATELARELPISRQAVAKHLAVLHDAGLAEPERSGRETRYRFTPAPLNEAASWMASVGADWDERLNRLAAHAKAANRRR